MVLGYHAAVLSSVQVVNENDREEDRESTVIKILYLHTVRIFFWFKLMWTRMYLHILRKNGFGGEGEVCRGVLFGCSFRNPDKRL